MGILDSLRSFWKGNNETVVEQEDPYEKSRLATQIVNLVSQISKINSFDSSIWNLNNVSSTELERRSVQELRKIHSDLSQKLSTLKQPSHAIDKRREELERSKWTGQKLDNMTSRDLDRLQKDDR